MKSNNIHWKRLIWTVVVSLYFIIFFRNMFHDALDGGAGLPVAFSWLFTVWMAETVIVYDPVASSPAEKIALVPPQGPV